ncbi:hypothetical protein Nepgr_031323 [Nepenthes gracilis]|uniref:Uncharacterized protein n=1 Tax=Nepenthes gracilis TaxID=150966 RepID=A0AAD3TGH5_NEPGR|nr:hypothetical protein Nepgr_031323 [Nepenthes gracilis]
MPANIYTALYQHQHRHHQEHWNASTPSAALRLQPWYLDTSRASTSHGKILPTTSSGRDQQQVSADKNSTPNKWRDPLSNINNSPPQQHPHAELRFGTEQHINERQTQRARRIDEVLASEPPNGSGEQRQGNHKGLQRISTDLAETAEIEGFTEDEIIEYPGESVQLGRSNLGSDGDFEFRTFASGSHLLMPVLLMVVAVLEWHGEGVALLSDALAYVIPLFGRLNGRFRWLFTWKSFLLLLKDAALDANAAMTLLRRPHDSKVLLKRPLGRLKIPLAIMLKLAETRILLLPVSVADVGRVQNPVAAMEGSCCRTREHQQPYPLSTWPADPGMAETQQHHQQQIWNQQASPKPAFNSAVPNSHSQQLSGTATQQQQPLNQRPTLQSFVF